MKGGDKIREILKQERQWSRSCRIAYANYRMGTAANAEEHRLWASVLAANSGSENTGGADVTAQT
jgi:hypothetical protein